MRVYIHTFVLDLYFFFIFSYFLTKSCFCLNVSLLWRYGRDVLLFARVSGASLWGGASTKRGAPLLLAELQAPAAGPWGPVAAVVALAITWRPALTPLTLGPTLPLWLV